jgi:hypothetical protein
MTSVIPTTPSYELRALDSNTLPTGNIPVFLVPQKFFNYKKEDATRKAFCIAFLNNLETENIKLGRVIDEGRLAVLTVKGGVIQSLTIKDTTLNSLKTNELTDAVVKMGNKILIPDTTLKLRAYASDEQYKNYTSSIKI